MNEESAAFPTNTYLFNVVPGFGTGFNEHDIQFFRFPLAVFRGHLSLVRQIRLVPH